MDCKNDTYKKFREWLYQWYSEARYPTEEEFEQILAEDSQFDYNSLAPGVSLMYEVEYREALDANDNIIQGHS